LLDSGAPFYDVYECADGKYISVGSIEPKFYVQLLDRIGVDPAELGDQNDQRNWPKAKEILAERFRTKTRAEWTALLEGTDACFAPVLNVAEAYEHPHLKARKTYINVAGVNQPAPAPRFSRTTLETPVPPAELNTANATDALRGWLMESEIAALSDAGTFC
jgi:crotonobetainyl-CoA:carnitine CoA-transferase CaiB-like acyl-CoA transferase